MRLFWEFSGQVERIWADEQRNQLQVAVSAQGGDACQRMSETLDTIAPCPVTYTGHALAQVSAVPDEGAANTLRALQG